MGKGRAVGHIPSIVDIDLIAITQIKLVISHPTPGVFEVAIGLRSDMQQKE